MAVEKQNTSSPNQISQDDWVLAVNELGKEEPLIPVFVQVSWSFGYLLATGFQPQVNARTIEIPLSRKSLADSIDGAVKVSLPRPGQGHYLQETSASGDRVLTMSFRIEDQYEAFYWVEIQIATNADLLDLVNSESRVQ
jgi:hypothetical protein